MITSDEEMEESYQKLLKDYRVGEELEAEIGVEGIGKKYAGCFFDQSCIKFDSVLDLGSPISHNGCEFFTYVRNRIEKCIILVEKLPNCYEIVK